jgi:hypothetical protein
MEEDVDVIARDAERGGDVFTVALFEHAKRDDRALRVAEAIDARTKPNVIFGAREAFVERVIVGDIACEVVFEGNVRTRDVVTAAFVARAVFHDAGEERSGFARQIPADRAHEIRAERIVYAIDGVFAREAFTARERAQSLAFGANDRCERVDDVVGGFHRGDVSRGP